MTPTSALLYAKQILWKAFTASIKGMRYSVVDILDQNEEYAIISSNTSYGLSRYDRIARDSSQVKEQDILY